MSNHRIALRCASLFKQFDDQPVLRDVTFEVAQGDILVLVGPSGCGKTTTLRLIAGFERLDSGSIEIDGRLVADSQRHLPPERRRMGMVFQDYAVFPHLSVGQNVGFALGKDKDSRKRIEELLAFVGLPGQGSKMPHELSGGEQQRVSLARALSTEPAVLLLDEPFSNLDAALRADVRAEVKDLLKASGTTAVFVTHDQEEALLLGDCLGVMNHGRLEQVDTPEQVFHRPKTRFVAEFLGQSKIIGGVLTDRGIETLLGLVPTSSMLQTGANVEVVVRSDDVAFDPDPRGQGQIIARHFTGMAYIYHIRLPEGTIIQSWQPHETRVAVGTVVAARFREADDLPVFQDGRLVDKG